jgi:hypothetical protein
MTDFERKLRDFLMLDLLSARVQVCEALEHHRDARREEPSDHPLVGYLDIHPRPLRGYPTVNLRK